MARDLGADEQVVAVLQYLRVLLIVVAHADRRDRRSTAPRPASGAAPAEDGPGWPAGLLFTVGLRGRRPAARPGHPAAGGGAARADGGGGRAGPHRAVPGRRRAGPGRGRRLPGRSGCRSGSASPGPACALSAGRCPLALALIVGADRRLRRAGRRSSPPRPGSAPLDGYLATTPGGLYAVLATATGSGADATFVLAVQVLRLFVMLLLRAAAGPAAAAPRRVNRPPSWPRRVPARLPWSGCASRSREDRCPRTP